MSCDAGNDGDTDGVPCLFVETGVTLIRQAERCRESLCVEALTRCHLADAALSLYDADVMATTALICGECRDDAMLVLADIPASPLVDAWVLGIIIFHCFLEFLVDEPTVLPFRVVVFLRHPFLKVDDSADGSCERDGLGPRESVEVLYIAEGDDVDTFTVLRDVAVFCGVEDTIIDMVAKCLECLADDFDCAPIVMRQEVLDVLEESGFWFLGVEDAGKLEEETASSLLIMAALP